MIEAGDQESRQSGFTLLELVVAVSILALVAVFSWRGLDEVVRTRDSLALAQSRLDGLTRGFNRIERDAASAQAAVLESGGRFRFLAGNSAAVEYRLDGAVLSREILTATENGVKASAPISLIDGIGALKVEVYRPAPVGASALAASLSASVPALAADLAARAAAAQPGMAGGWTLVAGDTPAEAPALVPASGAVPATTPGQPPVLPPPQPAAPTGLRITLTLKVGGDVQRIFMFGSAA